MTNLPLPVTTLIPDASLARTVAACMPAFAELAELIENVDGAIALRLVVARLRKSAGEPVDGYWARVVPSLGSLARVSLVEDAGTDFAEMTPALDGRASCWRSGVGGVCAMTMPRGHFAHQEQVNALVMAAPGRLASGCSNGRVIIWDVEWDWSTALCAASVDTGRGVRDLAAAGVKLFVAAEDGVRIWSWCGGGGDYDVLPTGPTEALVALDGVRLVAGGDDLAVWDLVTGERLSSWEVGRGVTCVASVSADLLVSGGKEKIVQLWDVRVQKCVRTLEGIARPKPPATELETRLCQRAATNELAALRLDAVKRLNGLASFDALTPSQKKATIHLVGGQPCLGTTRSDGLRARQPDVPVQVLKQAEEEGLGHAGILSSLVVRSDDSVISGSWDGTAKEWSLRDGRCLHTFAGHRDYVNDVALLDSRTLATASDDGSFRLCDVEGRSLLSMKSQPHVTQRGVLPVKALAGIDAGRFASGDSCGCIKVWSALA